MLLSPNYEEHLFSQLCGDGILVVDPTTTFKPLLLIYSPDHGLLVYRLFNYRDEEPISRYGGEDLSGDLGAASFGLHNLSLGGGKILYGSVSRYHSLESS
jgi:hypothetical protein